MVAWLIPVRVVQLVFAIIVLGLSGWLVSLGGGFSEADYNVFVALWTILACVFFIASGFMEESVISHPIVAVVIDALSWIFWLAAYACMAHILDIFDTFFFRGTDISVIQAVVAFGVLEWLIFSATLGFNIFTFLKGGSSKGPATNGAPRQGV